MERRWFTGIIDNKSNDDFVDNNLDPQADLVLFYGNISPDAINDCTRIVKVPAINRL